jgi:DNA-binding CsgD family transcriptional regulator
MTRKPDVRELSYQLCGQPDRHSAQEATAVFLAEAIGGESIGCVSIDLATHSVDGWSPTPTDGALELFSVVARYVPTVDHYVKHPHAGAASRLSDLISTPRWRQHRAYQDCYKALGLLHQLAIPVALTPSSARGVGWFINRAERDFTDDELRLARAAQQMLALLHRTSAPPLDDESREEARQRAGLTRRELDIIALVGWGLSAQQIATLRRISICTVHKHLQHVYDKLGPRDRLSAVNKARALGLI